MSGIWTPAPLRDRLLSPRRQRGFFTLPGGMGSAFPPSGGLPPAPNPSWANVTFLLHGEGSDGSTTITDSSSSPKSPSIAGNVQIDTAQFKYGAASILFDGSGDYLEYASNSAWNFGTGDFTLECWVRFAAYSSSYGGAYGATLFSQYRATAGSPVGWQLRVNGTSSSYDQINVFTGTTNLTFNGAALALNTWHHVAASRNSGNVRAFVNGIQYGSTTSNSDNFTADQVGSTRPLRIGQLFDATFLLPLNGHLDEVRFAKEGIYTTNFIPPTAQFPDS